jgi:muramoyltetrapeptide carboxypeptidase
MVLDPGSTEFAVRPASLEPGDTVGIVAPASNIDPVALAKGCEALRQLGYKVVYDEAIASVDLYFAGSIERRVRELERMFEDPTVKAIVCARGGYGANYLLPYLRLDTVLRNPKIFVGYSDITSLLTYFTDHGLVTFHGPMVAKDWAHDDAADLGYWRAVLGGESVNATWSGGEEIQGLANGNAEGVLYGGCLSMLTASLGTPYEAQTEGKLLFIEDIGTKPYQVDRMLMQLKLAGKLEGVRGFVFGEMNDCFQPGGQTYTMQEVIMRIISDLNVPFAYGLRSGHVSAGNRVLPFGVGAQLTVQGHNVTFNIDAATVSTRSSAIRNGV